MQVIPYQWNGSGGELKSFCMESSKKSIRKEQKQKQSMAAFLYFLHFFSIYKKIYILFLHIKNYTI
ncbi:hypothetical protein BSA41_07310 [Bacillus safensis]|nr:hypothetical protein BSA41_07310 [Bacillus safensis]